MAFSVSEESGLFPVIHLKDEKNNTTAEIYSFGALLNAFTIQAGNSTQNVIDGFISPQDAAANITAGFKSARLSPFVCRVTGGKYAFEGKEYTINKFFLGNEAIHGLVFDAPFIVKSKGADDEQAYVTLEYGYNKKDEGYPFSFHSVITYTLKKQNTLSISTVITNTGKTAMPLADGWHPYFTLGGSINDLLVQFNTKQMLEFNEHLVPTGNFVEYTTLSTPKYLGETFLDNCFVLDGYEKPACIITNEANGLQLSITAVKNYPYLQVYTPPHRKSIAIENLSSAPDAFNNGIGLIIAKPLEQYTFATDYKMQLSR